MSFTNYLEDENDKPYFTKNSLAYYYDKMEGFAKAVEGSAKELNLTKEEVEKRLTLYIEQNKSVLDLRLKQWDEKLGKFDSSVETLLTEWVDDGTLTHVIDSTLIDEKIAPVAAHLAETESALNKRLDVKIIESGAAVAEVVDARVSTERNKDYGLLTKRFESIEKITKPYLENLIGNGDFSNGVTGWVNAVGTTLSATANTLKITSDGTNANPQANYSKAYGAGNFFVSFKVKLTDPNNKVTAIRAYLGATLINIRNYENGGWVEFSQLYTNVNMTRLSLMMVTADPASSVGIALEVKDVVVVDLNATANGGNLLNLSQAKELISQFPNKFFNEIAPVRDVLNAFNQLERKYKTVINVKEFGAVGDGVVDDTNALTAALLAGSGKTVIFPEGTYKITSTLYIETETHVKFLGKARIIVGDNYNFNVILWRGQDAFGYIRTRPDSKNITIENLRLTGNKTQSENKFHYGLVIYNTTNCIVKDCEIDYINYNPAIATTSSIMGFNLFIFGSTDVSVLGGRYEYGGYENIGLEDVHNILIEGVYSGTAWRTSLQLHRGSTSVKIINNYIEQNNVTTGHAALTLHGGEGAAGKPLNDVLISGNTIIANVFPDDIRKGGICSIADGEHNVKVINNDITSNNFGITVALGRDWDISHNRISSTRTSLYLIGWEIRVANNKIIRPSTSTMGHCITITDRDANDILIVDNYIEAPYSKGILSSVDINRLKISGNTIISAGECVSLYGGKTTNSIIDRNILESTANHGIYYDYNDVADIVKSGCLITNNIIKASQNAILLNAHLTHPIITGNSVLSGSIGIRVARGVDYALISLNDLTGATVKTKIDSGTNHQVVNNLV